MIPFHNFGCRDTVKVAISGAFSPTFHSSTNNAPCAPHTITFFNQTTPATQVLWNFGDGTTGTGDTVNHTYLTPGNYQVSMTVTLANGCVGTTSETVIINQPTGSFNYIGGNFCGNKSITFNVSALNAASYTWEFGDGATITNNQSSITHNYILEGHYVPKVTIHFSSGCDLLLIGSDSISIDKINADFTYTVEQFCGYSTLHFTSTSTSISGITSFSWNFGNGNFGNNAFETFTFSTSGGRYIKLIVTSNNGCVDSINKLIRINIWNFPTGNITGPLNACAGDSVLFTHNFNALDSIDHLQWLTDEGFTTTSNQANVIFNTPGSHSIILIGTNVHGCSDTLTKSIFIKPIPVFTQPQDMSLCNGAISPAIALASLYPGGNFSWSNDNVAIGLSNSGFFNIPRFTAINSSNSTIQANITLSVIAQGCSYTAPSFMISVQPTPTVNQPANQTVCNGSLTSAVVFTNNTNPNTTYTWQNNDPSIGLASSGLGTINIFTATNASSSPKNADITVTPIYNGCAGTPSTFDILVNPTPVVSVPSNQNVCNGVQTNAIQFSVLPLNTSLSWTNSQTSIGLAGNGNGNIASFQAINTIGNTVTAQISVSPNYQGCVGNTQNFTIQVNPTPDVIQPQNQQVCFGASTSLIDFNSNISGTTFNWNNNNSNIGLSINGTGNISPFTPINNTSFSDSAFISVMPSLNGCFGLPKLFFIALAPNLNFTAPVNQSYCNGQTTSLINFNLPSNGSSINWVNSNSSIGLSSSGVGNILPFVATNSGNSIATANIIVTNSYLNCPSISHNFNMQVNPNLTLQQPENIDVCPGETVNQIQFLASVSGASFTWSNSNTNIGLAANGTGNIPSFTATNNSLASATAQITVTGIYNGCNPVQRRFSIIVNPLPVVNNILDLIVCNGKITDTIFLNGPNAGTQYSWTNSNPSIGLAPRGTGHIMPFVASNTTTQTQSGLVEIQGETVAHCTALVKVFKIFVNPTPRLMTGNDVNICRGSNASLSVSGASSYSWSPSIGLSCSNCENPTVTASTSTTYFIEGTNASGCRNRDSIKVNVVQPFDMIVSPNDTVCAGKSIQLNANRATRYQWSPAIGLNNPNIANPIATPSISTMYTVVGFDAMGCFTDTASVYLMIGQNPSVQVGPDISAQTGSIITLNSSVPNGSNVSYNWSPSNHLSCNNCPNPSLTVTGNQMLTLTVQNKYGCTAVDSLYVVTFCKDAQVFVANAFTPDGDNINDMLIVRGTGITVKSFRVFNRWGNVVFEKQHFQPNDPKFGWNGKVNGVPATPDVYVYIAEVTCDNGTVYFHKGNATILK
jgi:gliding motility-associated-like protein